MSWRPKLILKWARSLLGVWAYTLAGNSSTPHSDTSRLHQTSMSSPVFRRGKARGPPCEDTKHQGIMQAEAGNYCTECQTGSGQEGVTGLSIRRVALSQARLFRTAFHLTSRCRVGPLQVSTYASCVRLESSSLQHNLPVAQP